MWITWLANLMAGDLQCTWSPWFKTHYTSYPKMPSTFELAQWQVDHNALLAKVVDERRAIGERLYKESQNSFQVRLSPTVSLGGKPDLVTIASEGRVRVFDVKTGAPKISDQVQMMLYLLCLPSAFPQYKELDLSGSIVYSSGLRAPVPSEAVTADFKRNARQFLNMLDTDVMPERAPSPDECRYCDITTADCSERVDTFPNGDIPDLDW